MKRLAVGLTLPTLALIAIYAAHLTTDWTFTALTEDPLSGANPLPATGTNLMLLGWAATIGVCTFTWAVTRDRFFAIIGALTVGLWADDAFMVHDYWFAVWGSINEKVMFLLWGVAAWVVALKFRRRFRATEPTILLVAVGLLAGSVFFDRDVFRDMNWVIASLDDACKLLGIYAWLTWCVLAGMAALGDRGVLTTGQ